MKPLFFHELSEEAKKIALDQVYQRGDYLSEHDYQMFYDWIKEDSEYLCSESGFNLNKFSLDDWGRLDRHSSDFSPITLEKVLGARLFQLYQWVEDYSGGYSELEVRLGDRNGEYAEFIFDNRYADFEEMYHVVDKHYRHVNPKNAGNRRYSLMALLSPLKDLEDRFYREVQEDFEKVGQLFCDRIAQRLNEKIDILLDRLSKSVEEQWDGYLSKAYLCDELSIEGSHLNERFTFYEDGTIEGPSYQNIC